MVFAACSLFFFTLITDHSLIRIPYDFSLAEFIVLTGGIKSTLAWGCRTSPPGFIGWRAGTTILCRSQLDPPGRDYEFGYCSMRTCSQIHSPRLGDIVDSGIGLSYQNDASPATILVDWVQTLYGGTPIGGSANLG